jgi:hypothetical protein
MISFKQYIAEQTGLDTTWQDGDVKISIQDVLKMTDEPIEINPNELKHLLIQTDRDPARVQAADLQYPLVVTTKGGQYTKILDGQHRLMKALQAEVLVKVRVLNLDNAPEEYQQMFENILVKEGWLDKLQVALDVIGFEPTVGTAADAANSVISALRSAAAIARRDGDSAKQHAIDAGISAISMIPFGDVAKIAKLRKLRKPAVTAARLAKNAGKAVQLKRRRQSAQQIASFGSAGVTTVPA